MCIYIYIYINICEGLKAITANSKVPDFFLFEIHINSTKYYLVQLSRTCQNDHIRYNIMEKKNFIVDAGNLIILLFRLMYRNIGIHFRAIITNRIM